MKNPQQIHKFPLLPSFLLRIFQKKKKKMQTQNEKYLSNI